MSEKHARPSWPLLLLLACLLVLSALAPRSGPLPARRPPQAARTLPPMVPLASPKQPPALESHADQHVPRERALANVPAVGFDVTDTLDRVDDARAQHAQLVENLPMAAADDAETTTLVVPSSSPAIESAATQPAAAPHVELALRSVGTALPPPATQADLTKPAPIEEPTPPLTAADPAAWQLPQELRERLIPLRDELAAAPWATRILDLLEELKSCGGPRDPRATVVLARLTESNNEIDRVAAHLHQEAAIERLRRAGYALSRRLTVWQQVSGMPRNPIPLVNSTARKPERLLACLNRLDEVTRSAPQGDGWRRYLLFDNLRDLANTETVSLEQRRGLSRQVLDRLNWKNLSLKQRRFMTAHPLLTLKTELRDWAAEPADLDQLLAELEDYEQTRHSSAAELVAAHWRQLSRADLTAAHRLAHDIEENYRGANLRIVLSEALLQRMMPPAKETDAFVHESIMGIPTSGTTHTTTDLVVRLVPDPNRMRFILEANGGVTARTSCKATGATVWTGMNSTYQILKPFEFTLAGLKTEQSEADATTHTHLRGVDTPISGIPLLGSIVDDYVRKQYSARKPTAEQELRRKIIARAYDEMDTQAQERIKQSNDLLKKSVLEPLENLSLDPTAIGMETSADRLTMRLRLAGDHQLGAHTPRPRAPSDSLASFQIHESAFNNLVSQLDLNGRTFSQAELLRWIAERLNRPLDSIPPNIREDVFLTFAPNDAFQIRIKDERLEITLVLDELRAEGTNYRDFTVRVFYRPDNESRTGDLVRDGVVQLIGSRITTKGQIALRGIFSKTFPREKRFSVLPKRFSTDPQLSDIAVTQIVLHDGWLGIALGVPRTANRTAPVAVR